MFRLKSPKLLVLGSIGVIGICAILIVGLSGSPPHGADRPPLFIYCAAGIRAPVDAAAKQYEIEYGVPFTFQYGPSFSLLVQAELSKKGDVYLPADDFDMDIARQKGMIEQAVPLARVAPVLAVAQGNPKKVRLLSDLLRPDVRLGQPSSEVAAAGRLVKDALQQTGQWEQISARTTVIKPTVNDIASDLKVGTIDAGFVWDVLAKQYGLEVVAIPELADTHALVTVGALKSSSQPDITRHFIQYLAEKDKGLRKFEDNGFVTVNAEP